MTQIFTPRAQQRLESSWSDKPDAGELAYRTCIAQLLIPPTPARGIAIEEEIPSQEVIQ